MRINILTQPLFCNYGGILQNFALQTVLKRLGHEPLTINVPVKLNVNRIWWKDIAHGAINMAKRLGGTIQSPFLLPSTHTRKEHELSAPQRDFIKRRIKKVDVAAPFPTDICDKYPADAWIVGSDQIWRPWCSPYIINAFFDFIESDNIKRIAYAVSFGTDTWELSSEQTTIVKPLAARFDAISVRESSGIQLCRDYLNVTAQHVLDPTLLLSADDYINLTSATDSPQGDYIASYILDINSVKAKQIKALKKQFRLPIIRTGMMRRHGFDSIERWIATIAKADRVITDSFHGTVFSVIFGRPVKILTNDIRGNARLYSLIAALGLSPDSDGFCQITDDVKTRLSSLRSKSLSFLTESLS